jgi:uncharacterized protein
MNGMKAKLPPIYQSMALHLKKLRRFSMTLYVDFYDPDHSYDEHRYILIGESHQGRLLFVSYMERNDVIRLISAREATRSEREAYEQD